MLRLTLPRTALALICLLSATTSSAEIYKYTDANGKVVYSENPPTPDAKDSTETVKVDPNANVIKAEVSKNSKKLQAEREARRAQAKQQQDQSSADYQAQLEQARADLEQARQLQKAGQDVQPGDFIGKKSGGVRPSYQRLMRLKELDENVKKAQAALRELENNHGPQILVK